MNKKMIFIVTTITGLAWLISSCAGEPANPVTSEPTDTPQPSPTPVPPTETAIPPTETAFPSATPPPIDPELLADLEDMIANIEEVESDLIDSIIERVMENPSSVVASIVPKLGDSKQSESALAVYAWVLGVTQNPAVIDPLVELAKDTTSTWVKSNCIRSIGSLGGEQAGQGLLSLLEQITDKDQRYEILNILAGMQYEPALPMMGEILAVDPNQEFWKPIFIFGKMGDLGVPYLLDKIDDDDVNIRTNSISQLGQLLTAPEAAQPLQEHYWVEEDPGIRGLILSSLEMIAPDLETMRSFAEEVINKEKDPDLVNYAQETIDSLPDMRTRIDSFISEKNISSVDFKAAYNALYDNYGYGDKKSLANTSTFEDEAKLKKLREKILQRDSDEALYDYFEVNEIIRLNRLAQAVAEQEGKPWEAWPTATPEPPKTPEPTAPPPLGSKLLPPPAHSIPGHWYALAVSPNSKQIAVSGDEGIEIFDATTLDRIHYFDQFDLGYITEIAFSPDGKKLAFIHSPFFEDLPDSLTVLDIDTPQTTLLGIEPDEPLAFTIYLEYNPNGRVLVWGIWSYENEDILRFFDSESGALLENQPDIPALNIQSGAFSSDGKLLGICCSGEAIILWDMQENSVIGEIPGAGKIGDLFFTPDGKSLMGRDGESQQIYSWDLGTLKPNQLPDDFAFNPIEYDYGDFSFSPDGRFMSACYMGLGDIGEHAFVVFDAQTGEPIVSTVTAHCLSYAFTSDEKMLVLLTSSDLQVYEMNAIMK